MSRLLRRQGTSEGGFTLVELLVAMTILGVFFAVFTTVTAKVFDTTRRQQSRSSTVDVSRNVVQVLDRQVRYANRVNAPVVTSDGTSWVEWQTGSAGLQQTCYQWRARPSGQLQYRTWMPVLNPPPATNPAVPARPWTTVGYGIGPNGTAPIFSVDADFPGVAAGTSAASQDKQQLTVSFLAGRTAGKDGAPTRVALTALNTPSPAAPLTPVCQNLPPGAFHDPA